MGLKRRMRVRPVRRETLDRFNQFDRITYPTIIEEREVRDRERQLARERKRQEREAA